MAKRWAGTACGRLAQLGATRTSMKKSTAQRIAVTSSDKGPAIL